VKASKLMKKLKMTVVATAGTQDFTPVLRTALIFIGPDMFIVKPHPRQRPNTIRKARPHFHCTENVAFAGSILERLAMRARNHINRNLFPNSAAAWEIR
jgi:hypothetical protein